MKICVFSDSHGNVKNMQRAVEREKPALCFFLGDGERDLAALQKRLPELPLYAVRGNCDLRSALPGELRCAVLGVRIFAAHGHLQQVKYDPALHELRAAAGEAEVILFGHTHEPRCEERGGKLLLNPGAIGAGSYGLLFVEDGRARAELRTL